LSNFSGREAALELRLLRPPVHKSHDFLELKDGKDGTSFLEGIEIFGLIIGGAVLPAAEENLDSLESQGADDGVIFFTFGRVISDVVGQTREGRGRMMEGARHGQPIGPRKFKLLKGFSMIVIVSSSAATLVMVDCPLMGLMAWRHCGFSRIIEVPRPSVRLPGEQSFENACGNRLANCSMRHS
jgi:hypothetical protein